MEGVCTCTGNLRKKTFAQAWATAGRKFSPGIPYANDDCYQCEKCNMIYGVAQVRAKVEAIEMTDDETTDFGFADGKLRRN